MSRTSLGQKQIRQRDESNLRQVQSIRRVGGQEDSFQTQIRLYQEVQYFLHMKEKYLKVEKENRFFDIDKEVGECFTNIKDGYGLNVFKNGDRYIGFWQKNTMHGMGIYVFKTIEGANPIAYLGQFFYGKFHGLGKLVRMLDEQVGQMIYRGTWVDGKKSEQGIYFYQNPTIYYQGGWFHDEKNGEGRFVFPNGEYIGTWQNNVRHGQGKLRKLDNKLTLIYQGIWESDELAQGEIIYLDSNSNQLGRYKGQLYDGKRHGKGIYSWKNASFNGIFQDDSIKGQGTLKTTNNSITGFFYSSSNIIQDARNLQAVINYENKDVYEGTVSINQGTIIRQKGVYRFGNGDVAEGHFNDSIDGKLDGRYFYRWKSGQESSY